MQYADESMQRLSESLGATSVLSKEYRGVIEGWALNAVSDGYHRGVAVGVERGTKKAREQFDAYIRMLSQLRRTADDDARLTYTVALGQLKRFDLIDEETWRKALDGEL